MFFMMKIEMSPPLNNEKISMSCAMGDLFLLVTKDILFFPTDSFDLCHVHSQTPFKKLQQFLIMPLDPYAKPPRQ